MHHHHLLLRIALTSGLLFLCISALPSYSSQQGHNIENCPVHKSSSAYFPQLDLEHVATIPREVWTRAIGASIGIGLIPVVVLLVLPIGAGFARSRLLTLALAFAAGGLLGDVFMHLIPHSVAEALQGLPDHHEEEEEHHHHGHGVDQIMQLGYNILLGIFVFFVLDKVVRIASGNSGHSHGHEEDDAAVHKKTDSDSKAVVAENKKVAVSSSAVLNIIADFAHNVTDGLAIGAAFATAKTDHEISAAFMTVLAILMHELPHELGDIALLIKSGMSRGAAIGMQVFTAIGCVVGSILGVLIESSGKHGKSENQSWIIPFTAGGFLYIALAVIIPELLSVTYQGRKGSSFRMGVLQIVFLYAGIYFMQEMSHFE